MEKALPDVQLVTQLRLEGNQEVCSISSAFQQKKGLKLFPAAGERLATSRLLSRGAAICRSSQGSRISQDLSRDIPGPPGQGPLQPALGDPASAGGLDWVTHRGPFQPPPFCDSVKEGAQQERAKTCEQRCLPYSTTTENPAHPTVTAAGSR